MQSTSDKITHFKKSVRKQLLTVVLSSTITMLFQKLSYLGDIVGNSSENSWQITACKVWLSEQRRLKARDQYVLRGALLQCTFLS